MTEKTVPIIVTLSLTLFLLAGCNKEVIETTTVAVKSGLVLREAPDTSAKKILVIPHRASVGILSYSNTLVVIGGKTAPWVEVRYGEKEGWVFSGFLASYVSQEYEDKSKLGLFAQGPFLRPVFPQTIGTGLKDAILENLQGRGKIKSSEKENRHDPAVIDKHHTITADGITITIYEAVKLKKEIIESVTITGDTFPLKYGIKKGMRTEEVEKIFGLPGEKMNGVYTYFTGDAVPVTIIFSFNNDKLAKILLAYQVD